MDNSVWKEKTLKALTREKLYQIILGKQAELAELKGEIKRLKRMLNPEKLYGIRKGQVEEFCNVEVEYHFEGKPTKDEDREDYTPHYWSNYPTDFGKTIFFTHEEAEAHLPSIPATPYSQENHEKEKI